MRFAGAFFADVFLAGRAVPSFEGDTKARMEAPSSRVSTVLSMLGDFNAFWASFLTLGDVIAAGALGILKVYCNGTCFQGSCKVYIPKRSAE